MSRYILIISFILPLALKSQQSAWQKFWSLPLAEKTWVALHPAKAKKVWTLKPRIDSLVAVAKKSPILDGDEAGGQVDAFRHLCWMYLVAQKIGRKPALKLGRAHERGNKQQFKRKKYNARNPPDRASMVMDLYNNQIGVAIEQHAVYESGDIVKYISGLITNGTARRIRKDEAGNSLGLHGFRVLEWEGRWENGRVVVPSNQLY